MANISRSPFPGMNPYLERSDLWPDVHNRLITIMANNLAPQVRPQYYVAIEERIYATLPESSFIGRADATMVEPDDAASWPRITESLAPYLQALLQDLYRQAGYDLRIDYRSEPVPPLAPPDAAWADELLRQAGVRA